MAPVVDAGQAVDIRHLFHSFERLRTVDSVSTDIGHSFESVDIFIVEGIGAGVLQRQHPQFFA